MWAFLDARLELLAVKSTLHLAPEGQIRRQLVARLTGRYVTGDMRPGYDTTLDLTALPFPDDSFDLIICCHVLEHVSDDRQAMREIARVLQPGGHAVIQVPQMKAMPATDEEPNLTAAQRAERYGQEDHLRIYGGDLIDRLERAGMEVEEVLASSVGVDDTDRWCVGEDEALYDCTVR